MQHIWGAKALAARFDISTSTLSHNLQRYPVFKRYRVGHGGHTSLWLYSNEAMTLAWELQQAQAFHASRRARKEALREGRKP